MAAAVGSSVTLGLGGSDLEMKTVALESPLNRSLARDVDAKVHEEVVEVTGGCKVTVVRSGDPAKPAMLTYHDLGLNYVSNFQVTRQTQNYTKGSFKLSDSTM